MCDSERLEVHSFNSASFYEAYDVIVDDETQFQNVDNIEYFETFMV